MEASTKAIAKMIFNKVWAAKQKAMRQVLAPRNRAYAQPVKGKFTKDDIDRIITVTHESLLNLMPEIPPQQTIGSFQQVMIGVVDLAFFRALRSENVEATYATELVSDVMWQACLNSGGNIPVAGRLIFPTIKRYIRDPLRALDIKLRLLMRYPYSPPGYKIAYRVEGGIAYMDVYRCPVWEFYRQFGDEEIQLFRQTWCTFDYTAAETMVDGGRYERSLTLSDGDEFCDQRWFVQQP